MTSAEITAFFPNCWPPPFYYDATYAVPTSHWLFGTFLRGWKAARSTEGLMTYTRRNDCDNFARACAVAAQDAWSETDTANDSEGISVGEFCYHRSEGRGAHAIVVAITDEGLLFVEPQLCERVALHPTEIASAFRISF